MINKNQPHASRAQGDSMPSPCCKREAVERAHQRTAVERVTERDGVHMRTDNRNTVRYVTVEKHAQMQD